MISMPGLLCFLLTLAYGYAIFALASRAARNRPGSRRTSPRMAVYAACGEYGWVPGKTAFMASVGRPAPEAPDR